MPRLLVAADEEILAGEHLTILEAAGFHLINAGSLKAAMSAILEDPPDLLLLARGFAAGGDEKILAAARSSLRRTSMPVILLAPDDEIVKIDWAQCRIDELITLPVSPGELMSRIKLAMARMNRVFDNNPLSRLPGNTSIIQAIQTRLDSGDEFAVCYLDIDNFKPYNDRYGFTRGDEVILMVARLLINGVDEGIEHNGFIGHVGGDDFVFIVSRDNCPNICEKIINNFSMVRNMFLSEEDLEAGGYQCKDRQDRETFYELLSISIAVVPVAANRFSHYGEVSSAATQLKHHVKEMDGSNFIIDRRNGYRP